MRMLGREQLKTVLSVQDLLFPVQIVWASRVVMASAQGRDSRDSYTQAFVYVGGGGAGINFVLMNKPL